MRFGKRQVFSQLNMRIGRGEAVGLIGANGAGKTTLMQTLAGLLKPRTGSVRLRSADGDSPLPPGACLFLQDRPATLPRLTPKDTLRMAAGLAGRNDADAEIDDVLQRAGLGKVRSVSAGKLSSGEAMRLSWAHALLLHRRLS